MEQRTGGSLLDHFSALEDPRQQAKVLYPLPEIMLLLLCATLAGADDFVEVQLWGNQQLAFLRRFRPYVHGIPSHDTLGEVIRALDPGLFKACFVAWVAGPRETEPDIVAVDGKTSRRPTRAAGAASRCTSSRPGRAASASCSGRRPWPASRTRSRQSRCCSNASRSPGHRQLDDAGRGKLTGQGGVCRQAATSPPVTSAQTASAVARAARYSVAVR